MSNAKVVIFQPSIHQQNIFHEVRHGKGNLIINAVAGAGKSKTLLESLNYMGTSDVIYIAFNKHTVEDLSSKLRRGVACKTIHSVGNGCLYRGCGKLERDDRKYHKLTKSLVNDMARELDAAYLRLLKGDTSQGYPAEPPGRDQLGKLLRSLVHFCMVTITDPSSAESMAKMITDYSIEAPLDYMPIWQAVTKRLLTEGERIAKQELVINFDEMLWLPWKWNLKPRRYKWVLLDECQDLSDAQRDMALKLVAKDGRMLMVGDPCQSIMAFSGANNQAFWELKRVTNAQEMPLSICYRCPENFLIAAREIVPHIEADPHKQPGQMLTISPDQLIDFVQEDDLIICRKTSPLIDQCIKMISRRISARVRGRDLSSSLTDIVRELVEMDGYSWGNFLSCLDRWRDDHVFKLGGVDASEELVEQLNDRVSGVRACYLGLPASNADQLITEIDNLFSNEEKGIILSTVHRSKGLEAERVFILEPENMPLIWKGQTSEQYQQEENLRYVALTRAKSVRVFVTTKDIKQPGATDEQLSLPLPAQPQLRLVTAPTETVAIERLSDAPTQPVKLPDNYSYIRFGTKLPSDLITAMNSCNVLALDTETTGWATDPDARISLIQIGIETADGIKVWIIDCLNRSMDLTPIKFMLANQTILKVIHYADFETKMFKKSYGWPINNIWDTCIVERKKGGKQNKLADLAHRYLGMDLDKTNQASDWAQRPLDMDQLIYAGLDADVTLQVYRKQSGTSAEFAPVVESESEPEEIDHNRMPDPSTTRLGLAVDGQCVICGFKFSAQQMAWFCNRETHQWFHGCDLRQEHVTDYLLRTLPPTDEYVIRVREKQRAEGLSPGARRLSNIPVASEPVTITVKNDRNQMPLFEQLDTTDLDCLK